MSPDITLQYTVESRCIVSHHFLLHVQHRHVWRNLKTPTNSHIQTRLHKQWPSSGQGAFHPPPRGLIPHHLCNTTGLPLQITLSDIINYNHHISDKLIWVLKESTFYGYMGSKNFLLWHIDPHYLSNALINSTQHDNRIQPVLKSQTQKCKKMKTVVNSHW